MTKNKMLVKLYEDYAEIKHGLEDDLSNLQTALVARTMSKIKLQQAQEELKAAESLAVLSETHKEGKINGKNAETRARQTDVLLAELRAHDADAYGLAAAISTGEGLIAKLDATTEGIRARLYANQALARMIAGLTAALQGCGKEAI